jgi:hypothetical protein
VEGKGPWGPFLFINIHMETEKINDNEVLEITEPFEGQQQLNKSTGEVEVYRNGDWCVK